MTNVTNYLKRQIAKLERELIYKKTKGIPEEQLKWLRKDIKQKQQALNALK